MPLSEHEQRLLEQMERALYAEDPKFASTLRDGSGRRGNRRHAALGVLAFLIGTALLVTGAAIAQEIVGVLGFVLMLGGALLVVRAMRAPAPEAEAEANASDTDATGGSAPSGGKKQSGGFMNRVEDRWNRRRDEQ
ncbi:MAG: DUF3040 domain-containing protein [Actinobacteria bacterium]|uniref:Unannotated protein n=1 Tax=freshwater metagenome TaxID=449393 RepID=A0A6J7QM56_9ZZZZ|nr:DUF3040 domain-containing protein [Actinomycetota bacterium]